MGNGQSKTKSVLGAIGAGLVSGIGAGLLVTKVLAKTALFVATGCNPITAGVVVGTAVCLGVTYCFMNQKSSKAVAKAYQIQPTYSNQNTYPQVSAQIEEKPQRTMMDLLSECKSLRTEARDKFALSISARSQQSEVEWRTKYFSEFAAQVETKVNKERILADFKEETAQLRSKCLPFEEVQRLAEQSHVFREKYKEMICETATMFKPENADFEGIFSEIVELGKDIEDNNKLLSECYEYYGKVHQNPHENHPELRSYRGTCLCEGCDSKKRSPWYHTGCGGALKINSLAEVKCESCNALITTLTCAQSGETCEFYKSRKFMVSLGELVREEPDYKWGSRVIAAAKDKMK